MAIIRHSGVVFEGDQGKKYAHAVERIVESVATGLEEVAGESGDVVRSLMTLDYWLDLIVPLQLQDEIRFMRIRTKRHELLISPGTLFVYIPATAKVDEHRHL